MEPTLYWCHGGCFGGGSSTYDKSLRDYLSKNGWWVIAVEFSLTNYDDALVQIINAVEQNRAPVTIVGGISSGGFLAHQVANILELPAVLVAPVLAPYTRHPELSTSLQEQQLSFFQTPEQMKAAENSVRPPNAPRAIFYGINDTRAPTAPYESWLQPPLVTAIGYAKDHATLCKNPPRKDILSHLNGWL